MLKMGELERLELNMLAMYCLRVAESAAANSLQAEQASKLKTEWGLLIGSTRSQEDIEVHGKELKQRMVSFLAVCSLSLSLAEEPATTSDFKANHAAVGHGK